MYHGDQKIKTDDIRQIDRESRNETLANELLEVMKREPLLAEMMGENWAQIDLLLDIMPITQRHKAAIRQQITLLATKPLVLLDRTHRRLWDDTLPQSNGDDHAE